MNILIIGGGAAGMAAALTASERPEHRVVLAERQARTGRKLLSTGNGRCNLTNRVLTAENYHGQQPDFCRPALALFPPEQTLAWFASMGLLTVTEPGGRVYPFSDSATTSPADSVTTSAPMTSASRRFSTTSASASTLSQPAGM